MENSDSEVNLLNEYGFLKVGQWEMLSNEKDKLVPVISEFKNERVIYSFVENNTVRYIGIVKSGRRTLQQRLNEYRNPYTNGKGSTNAKVGIKIIEALTKGNMVEIFALKPYTNSGKSLYSDLKVDLVAGLESGLIEKFGLTNPEKGWNKSS